jgi:tripartite-type tricarboxylate transporter receptor subunit TctC
MPAKRLYSPAMIVRILLLLWLCTTSVQAADEPYFEGKTITVIMGLDASAGGTSVGRLLAKHLAPAIEGNPTVVVKNMPGASLMKAHLYVLLKAPKDGTVIYYGPRSSLGELLDLPGHTFKYTQFEPLGGVQIAGLVVYARNDAVAGGMGRPADIVNAERLLFSGMAPDHGRMIISTLGLRLIGADYTYIAGYPSSGATRVAVLSGETNVTVDAAHAFLNQVAPGFVKDGHGLPLFSVPHYDTEGNLVANPLVPDILSLPALYEEIKNEPPNGPVWNAITTLIGIDQTMQHVFLGPPGMNTDAAAAIREAAMTAFSTEAFRNEAMQRLSFVPDPVGYERAGEILRSTADVSPAVLELIKEHIARNSQY